MIDSLPSSRAVCAEGIHSEGPELEAALQRDGLYDHNSQEMLLLYDSMNGC